MKKSFKRKARKSPAKESRATLTAANMPAGLRHTIAGQEFSVHESEVVKWLTGQPEILQALFDHYRGLGAIVFDSESGTWRGKGMTNAVITNAADGSATKDPHQSAFGA